MPFGVVFMRYIENIMVTVNSSINFIIYFVFGESFRNESIKMLIEFRKNIPMLSKYFQPKWQEISKLVHEKERMKNKKNLQK